MLTPVITGNNLFDSLDKLIGDTIMGIANLIYNIVQDGLRMMGNNSGRMVTIDDLVFDRYAETSIDFWDNVSGSTLIEQFKDNISEFYNRFKILAIVGYLIGLLYIGVRILIAVSGKQQQRYKEMLMCWITGVIILFFFPTAIKYAVKINHAFVTYLGHDLAFERQVTGTVQFTYAQQGEQTEEAKKAASEIVKTSFDDSAGVVDYMAEMSLAYRTEYESYTARALVYLIMVIQFIMFLIAYYKRLFMFSFLLVIFPIIAVTYFIDKVGDGAAQGFQTWVKEIMMNIFTQTIHAVVYVFVMAVVFPDHHYQGNWILAIIGITFVFKGEEILRSIIGQSGSMTAKSVKETAAKAVATVAVANAVTNKVTGTFGKGAKAVRFSRESRANKKIANELRKEKTTTNTTNETTTNTNTNTSTNLLSLSALGAGMGLSQGEGGTSRLEDIRPTTNEGKELLPAAKVFENPEMSGKTDEEIIQAYNTVLKYSNGGNEETKKIIGRLGITQDQFAKMQRVKAETTAAALKLDYKEAVTDPEKFKKKKLKINKDLELHLSMILTGDKNNTKSREVLMWKRALLGNIIDYNTDQIRQGLSGEEDEFGIESGAARRVNKAMDSRENADSFAKKVLKIHRFVDLSSIDTKSSKMFAVSTKRGGSRKTQSLTSQAQIYSQQYLNAFEGREPIPESARRVGSKTIVKGEEDRYSYALRELSSKQKKELAEDMAALKDFSERTHKSVTDLINTEEDDGYTLSDVKSRIQRIRAKVDDKAGIDQIIEREFGLKIEEMDKAVDNVAIAAFGDIGVLYSTPGREQASRKESSREPNRDALGNERVDMIETYPGMGPAISQNFVDAIARADTNQLKKDVDVGRTESIVRNATNRIEKDRKTYERVSERLITEDEKLKVETLEDAGEKSKVELAQELERRRVMNSHMISSNGEADVDEAIRFVVENKNFDVESIEYLIDEDTGKERKLGSSSDYIGELEEKATESEKLLKAKGQLLAQDNREKVANVLQSILDETEFQDEHELEPQFEGLTADDYDAIAKEKKKRAIEEALSLTGTVAGAATLGTTGGFLNIGMSSSDSMSKEFGAGFLAGSAISAGVAETQFGEGFGQQEIEVYNPYDGSYTKVNYKKWGSLIDGGGIIPFRDGERVEISDPRLAKVRTKVEQVLVEDYQKKKEARVMREAKEKASKFENALNHRSSRKGGK